MLWNFLAFELKKNNFFFQINARSTILIEGIWMKKTAQQITMGNVLVLSINHRYQLVVSIVIYFEYYLMVLNVMI